MKTAVLLAAGRGTRLKPYTDITPKPLLPVNGAPTLDLYFHALQAAGIEHAVLVTHYLATKIEHYAKQVPKRFGISCSTVHQHTLDGTASALEAAANVLFVNGKGINNGADQKSKFAAEAECQTMPFLLMATDYLIDSNFIGELIRFHEAHGADVSVSLKRVPVEELSSRSSVRFDSEENITEIVEKPELGKAPSDLSANLAFILPPVIFKHLANVKPSARGEREVQSALNGFLASGGSARGLIQPPPSEWTPSLLD